MENTGKAPLNAEEQAQKQVDKTRDDNSEKNSGSSEVDVRRHHTENNYGRTTNGTGVGHEPGTIPGSGI
ncbi:MAG: hypothetical protein EOP48_01475 [Sphingobacteriales bacterium]|nr:MAG: hypothetical protein EOP48_01475 [Sphingobacteriales bacterium]